MTETTASDSSGQGKINVMFITRLCTMSFPLFIAIILLIPDRSNQTNRKHREGDYPLAEEIRFFLMSAITCLTIKHYERVLMSPWDNS